ncbi:MAG: hypothetical protein R3Y32_08300 [Bacillota bacterium]
MKKFAKLFAIVLTLAMVITCFAGCGSSNTTTVIDEDGNEVEIELTTVRIGIHSNIGGAGLVAVADEMGFFLEEGINAEITVVESGPVEMAAMRAGTRTLEVGYIGSGVAWNALDGDGNSVSFVYFSGLGDAETMLSREGIFTDSNSDGEYDFDEIYEGLKGQTVYLDTSTTPGSWFKTLLGYVNEGKDASEQLWISCETTDYLSGYEAPNSNSANAVEVVYISNANCATAMSTVSSSRADIVVCFSPIPDTILAANDDVEVIAKTSTHFAASDSSIETFVASDEWIAEDPETVQAFVNALTKAAAVRNDDTDFVETAAENITNAAAGSYNASDSWWPTIAEYKEMFSSTSGTGYEYMEALYDIAYPNVTSGIIEDFEDTMDFSFMLEALNNIG